MNLTRPVRGHTGIAGDLPPSSPEGEGHTVVPTTLKRQIKSRAVALKRFKPRFARRSLSHFSEPLPGQLATKCSGKRSMPRLVLGDRRATLAVCFKPGKQPVLRNTYHCGPCSGVLFPANGGGAALPRLPYLYILLSDS